MSFIGVFSFLKCKTLTLKTTTWWTCASHFVDRWHLQSCQTCFFPHPLNGWHDHWTFVGDAGMGDLVWVIFFSQISLELEIFSLTYNGVRFYFFSIIRHERYLFQYRILFFPGIYLYPFSSRNQSAGYFVPKSPITPQKSNSQLLISTNHLASWQILICPSFLKSFETIGDKTL